MLRESFIVEVFQSYGLDYQFAPERVGRKEFDHFPSKEDIERAIKECGGDQAKIDKRYVLE